MRLVAKPERKGQRAKPPNIHHFNLEHKTDKGSQVYHYSVGADPVEVPDADAKVMLAQGKVMVYQEPVQTPESPEETEKARTGRRSKSG